MLMKKLLISMFLIVVKSLKNDKNFKIHKG